MTSVLRQQKRQLEREGRVLSRLERESTVKLAKAGALRRRAAAIVQDGRTTTADLLVAFELVRAADEVLEGVIRASLVALQATVRDGERAQAAIEALARKHRRRRGRAP